MKTQFHEKRKLMIPLFIIAAALLFGAAVMGLWNAVLIPVLGVKSITFLQAIGILILSKILFGGFRGGWGGRPRNGRWMEMQQKMAAMTPEEKEAFKSQWRNRCGSRWKTNSGNTGGTTEQPK